jgi:glycyl-tRNA synthetase
MDEIWVPLCITIDSNNYDNGDVTVRFRDTMEQQLVKITNLNNFVREFLK